MTATAGRFFLAAAVLAAWTTAASAQTLGDSLAQGTLSPAAFEQLIAGTGLSAAEAQSMTAHEVAAIKWTDD